MEQSEIKRIISEYDKLYEHTLEVAKKLNKLDNKQYYTARGIEDIEFWEDKSAQIEGLLNMLKQHEAGQIKLTALEQYNIKMFVGLQHIKDNCR